MNDLKIYEVGLRIGGKYSSFCESPDRLKVEEYAEMMKSTCPEDGAEIVFSEKLYRLVSTTPHIINRE